MFWPLGNRQREAHGSGDGGKPRFVVGTVSVCVGLKKEINLTFLKQLIGFFAMSLRGPKQVNLADS